MREPNPSKYSPPSVKCFIVFLYSVRREFYFIDKAHNMHEKVCTGVQLPLDINLEPFCGAKWPFFTFCNRCNTFLDVRSCNTMK